MNAPDDDRAFRRLLRWYPRAWRDEHGQALIGMLLDDADHAGRRGPTVADRRAAIVHGLATRLGYRAALVSAIVGMLSAVAASIWLIWRVTPGGELQHEAALMLSAGVAPAATAIAFIALLRSAAVLKDGHALLTVLSTVLAGACGGLAAVSWSRGFDNADASLPQTGLASAFLPLAASGLVLSAMSISIATFAVLSRWQSTVVTRVVLSAMCGGVAAPMLGVVTFTSPAASGLIALVGLIIAVRLRRGPSGPAGARVITHRARPWPRAARLAGITAFSVGALGIALAFTGEAWSPLGGNSTIAMRHGIIFLSLSTVPALIGMGLVALGRFRSRRRDVWVPVGAACVGFCLLALDYLVTTGSGDIGPLWVGAGASIGLGLGWAVAVRTPVSLPLRIAVGAATALVFTVPMGIILTPMLVFAAPLLGLILVVIRQRRPTSTAPSIA